MGGVEGILVCGGKGGRGETGLWGVRKGILVCGRVEGILVRVRGRGDTGSCVE